MRTSGDQYINGRLVNGYDYVHQAWVLRGVYQKCGHLPEHNCDCYGTKHQGEQPPPGDLTG